MLGPGTGDNAAAALGLAARPGDVIVSIGTSGVVSAVTTTAVADVTGTVAGFADASGHHLPLVATLNAARVLDAAAALLGVDHADALRPRAVGPLRRRRPGAGPLPRGRADAEPPAGHRLGARADAAHLHPRPLGPRRGRGTAVRARRRHRGGRRPGRDRRAGAADRRRAPRSPAVQQLAPGIFGRPVLVPPPGEYVADGAARQAAWVLSGARRAAGLGPARAAGVRGAPRPRACASATRRCAAAPTGSKRAAPATTDCVLDRFGSAGGEPGRVGG